VVAIKNGIAIATVVAIRKGIRIAKMAEKGTGPKSAAATISWDLVARVEKTKGRESMVAAMGGAKAVAGLAEEVARWEHGTVAVGMTSNARASISILMSGVGQHGADPQLGMDHRGELVVPNPARARFRTLGRLRFALATHHPSPKLTFRQ